MATDSPIMETIQVSAEMLALVGQGRIGAHPWPTTPVAFIIDVSGYREPPTFRFVSHPDADQLCEHGNLERLIFIVARDACDRLRGQPIALEDGRAYLLTSELRAIALSIRDCSLPAPAAEPYRLAKSIELLCEIIEADRRSSLIPVVSELGCTLSSTDLTRVAAAKMLIDERWQEALTLERIARHCGMNRSKLSRGFRELYGTSVAEALSDRRLDEARKELLVTDLPVGLIGYRSGYQNNASFTRAFGRRFGVSPTGLRGGGHAQ